MLGTLPMLRLLSSAHDAELTISQSIASRSHFVVPHVPRDGATRPSPARVFHGASLDPSGDLLRHHARTGEQTASLAV